MKWIRTTFGSHSHAIAHRGDTTTLCGIHLEHVRAIVVPGVSDRCENCDGEWRRRGRECKPRRSRGPRREVYVNRFTFSDWETLP